MRRRSPCLLALLLALGLAPPYARAEDPAPLPTLDEVLAALPAPSAERALHFDALLQQAGQRLGRGLIAAEPHGTGEAAGWRIRWDFALDVPGYSRREQQEFFVDRRLMPLRGRSVEVEQGATTTFEWRRESGVLTVRATPGEGAPRTLTLAVDGFVAPSIAVAVLLTALLGDQQRELSLPTVDISPSADDDDAPGAGEPDGEDAGDDDGDDGEDAEDAEDDDAPGLEVHRATLVLAGTGTWNERPARLVRGTRDDTAFEWAHDPASGAVLGLRLTPAGGPTVELVPAGRLAYATTAQEAAVQGLIGFASADPEMIDQVLHWPSVYAGQQAEHARETAGVEDAPPFPEEAEFRLRVLANVRERAAAGQVYPQSMIEQALEGQLDALTVTEATEGRYHVVFPPLFHGFRATVKRFDGRWYLVAFPDQGG